MHPVPNSNGPHVKHGILYCKARWNEIFHKFGNVVLADFVNSNETIPII
jgi:hypothetical protein